MDLCLSVMLDFWAATQLASPASANLLRIVQTDTLRCNASFMPFAVIWESATTDAIISLSTTSSVHLDLPARCPLIPPASRILRNNVTRIPEYKLMLERRMLIEAVSIPDYFVFEKVPCICHG
ncbi:hypothetical protein HPB51_005687 [Rhipicephalus microplus]|uniref:Secreted protein n=1 Tax=Rhipicephalus microplus TaxID=6941 RepID=A0A9J6EYT7_RHIMP|nr:hypothetical protein HPB51_005687 [Rhipicephalus microplus]